MPQMGWNPSGALPTALYFAAFLSLALANPGQPSEFAKPDYTIYHTKEQVFQIVKKIVAANPSFMKIETMKLGDSAYETSLQVVTVEPGGFTSNHDDKYRLLLNYGEHGRELITSEVAIRLLEDLAKPEPDKSQARGAGSKKLASILQHTVLKIIPMENTNGRDIVEGGQLCERKNGRGVDPNRNWELHWGFREKDYDPSEEFPGTKPFSEPEVAGILELTKAFKPHVWVNVHSGMEALFMPYDHVAQIPTGKDALATLAVLEALNKSHCGGRCAVGSGGKSVGYLAHGTATDYMYEKLNVPLAFTWEIYGNLTAHYQDCFRMFNPLGAEEMESAVDNWASAIFGLIELLPGHPGLPKLAISRRDTRTRSRRRVARKSRWL